MFNGLGVPRSGKCGGRSLYDSPRMPRSAIGFRVGVEERRSVRSPCHPQEGVPIGGRIEHEQHQGRRPWPGWASHSEVPAVGPQGQFDDVLHVPHKTGQNHRPLS